MYLSIKLNEFHRNVFRLYRGGNRSIARWNLYRNVRFNYEKRAPAGKRARASLKFN